MRSVFIVVFMSAVLGVRAQQPQQVPDTANYMIIPKLAITVAPLAMADYLSGSGARAAVEYRLGQRSTGLTEFTYLLPWHRTFARVEGFKIRQDIRTYSLSKRRFIGFSLMVKKQSIDHIAVVPLTDTTHYTKPYTLHKLVVAPSFVIGANAHFNHLFFEGSLYAGARIRTAVREGVTPAESATMWNSDMDYARWPEKLQLKNGIGIAPELLLCFRVGYVFG